MKTIVGVYRSNDRAVEAVNELKKAGYPVDQISLISRADIINNHLHIKTSDVAEKAELSIGVAAGTILGILTGVGVFVIPGLGFLYGAGAVVGAIAGLDIGIMGGGVIAILTAMGVDEAKAIKYEKQLKEGQFLVVAEGNEKEAAQAKEMLHTSGMNVELAAQ